MRLKMSLWNDDHFVQGEMSETVPMSTLFEQHFIET